MAKMEYQDLVVGSTFFRLFRCGMREVIKGTTTATATKTSVA